MDLTLPVVIMREDENKLMEFAEAISSVQFSRSVMSNSLRSHESQHARPPCPSPTPRVHPDSRPLSQWCHPAISSSVLPFSSCPHSLPASESFPPLHMRWPKYWSFSFSIFPSKEIPGLIFRMDWLDPLAVRDWKKKVFPEVFKVCINWLFVTFQFISLSHGVN